MIRDGRLTYPSAQTDWTSFEFENVALNTLAISALATIFSYQAAAIATDLIFGIKSRGQVSARNLHILLLTRQSSPLSILSSILRKDWVTRKRFSEYLDKHDAIARDEEKIHLHVIMKLMFVITLIPMVNVLAIVGSFEKSHSLTFRDVRFGGLALDVSMNQQLKMLPVTKDCEVSSFLMRSTDRTNISLNTCYYLESGKYEAEGLSDPGGSVYFSVSPSYHTTISVFIILNGYYSTADKWAGISLVEGPQMKLRSLLSQTSAEILANESVELLAKECRIENFNIDTSFEGVKVTKYFPCPLPGHKIPALMTEVILKLLNKITIVEFDKLEVQSLRNEALNSSTFEVADDYNFLVRNTRYVSVPSMAIVTAATIIIRAITKLLLKNDLGEGVHRIVKKRLGLLCWDSLLRAETQTVPYLKQAYGVES